MLRKRCLLNDRSNLLHRGCERISRSRAVHEYGLCGRVDGLGDRRPLSVRSAGLRVVHLVDEYVEAVHFIGILCNRVLTGRDLAGNNCPFALFFLGAHPLQEVHARIHIRSAGAYAEVLTADRGGGSPLVTGRKQAEAILERAVDRVCLSQMPCADLCKRRLACRELVERIRLRPVHRPARSRCP